MQSLTPTVPITYAPPPRELSQSEAEEFARILGVPVESIAAYHRIAADCAVEDVEQCSYEQLVADPIKSRLAPNPQFFYQIKVDVGLELARQYFAPEQVAQLQVLDIGCGTGELMRMLEPHFSAVYGCDPSQAMVRRAGRRAVHMPEVTRLPYAERQFDIAICSCVYHHIEPELRAAHLREIQRVLKPDGVLMIFEHNRRNPLTRFIVNRCPIDAAANLLYGSEMCRLMRQAGYRQVRTRYYLFMPQVLYGALNWLERLVSFTRLGGQFCAIGRNRPD
ncbi:MAG: Ubiquinone/menaquinone biosynthesis C-methyltransferase UbiE [Phycisphaerae bacterium]|nr:Ubiquinone/menaquinone biosynthesis C-methyltransferase UbiE [Phycisphaerae bacterium]